jgi:rare lipoprotein A
MRAIAAGLIVLLTISGSVEARIKVMRRQVGLASFYGAAFAGRDTASGRRFHPGQMVAAHRTLPLGSIVRVTNLENGRSVDLTIIDRGPFGRNRRRGCIIDVSRGAATRLGFRHDGLARVRVELLRRPRTPVRR